MNLLILKGFNNYFNRKIKKYSDLDDYKTNSSKYYNFSDINFNPNDGVVTEQVIGNVDQLDSGNPLDWENDGSPDYIVCYKTVPGTIIVDGEEVETAVDQIVSRWFVLESVRTRAGQYKLALKRDVIADHLEQILSNPCFVEKGYVSTSNPLIFNEEGVGFNEIKQGETMLKDETGIPWIVLYIAKNYSTDATDPNNPVEQTVPIEGKMILDTSQVLSYSDLPWSGLESGANMSNTTQIRRIPGAGEINISPIVASKQDVIGMPRYTFYPSRINHRHQYINNEWKVDGNTTNIQYIGSSNGTFKLGAINLTPADTIVRWGENNNGNKVVSVYNPYINAGEIAGREASIATASTLSNWCGLRQSSSGQGATNKTQIITYLNGKRTWLESSTGHSTVPGQPNMEAYVGGPQAFLAASSLLAYNNKIVTSDNINYYRVKITRANNYTRPIDYFTMVDGKATPSTNNNLTSYFFLPGDLAITSCESNSANTMIETFFEHAWFDVQYEMVTGDLLRFTMPTPTARNTLNEAAYDMLVFPYGAIDFKVPNDNNPPTADLSFKSSKEASMGIARSIAAKIGDALYDMQLLPYCPYRQIVEQYAEDGYIDLGRTSPFPSGAWSGVYKINSSGDTPSRSNSKSFGLWCITSHDTFNIIHTIETPTDEDPVEYKLFNASRKFRLVSPNYSSVFEFNPLKNKGVTIFNVDFTYKPYNPYIHIAPYFNSEGLYGVDTNDQRGLILQGDFSVGYYSDKWANYEIQNANYANIFDRQIQNIDSMQKLEREQTRTQYGMNIATEFLGLGGGLKGASAGSAGGPWGALIGGIAGTVGGGAGSIAGAALDERWMNWSQQEARSYAIDMYNYNLGNVKALPYGLAKSDALTENFKYFPFIEEYDCTEIEKEIFRNKLKYDGMTVGAIGTIASYLPAEGPDWEFQMLKGRMIMAENIADDFHIVDAIYQEVLKGFYYVNQYTEPEGE